MTDRSDLRAVARSAIALYFEPVNMLRLALRNGRADPIDAFAASRQRKKTRRSADRHIYGLAVAFGLIAVVMSLSTFVSMFKLRDAQSVLQSNAFAYAVEVSPPQIQHAVLHLDGIVHSKAPVLASALSGRTDMRHVLATSKLDLIPLIRVINAGPKWTAGEVVQVEPNGTFTAVISFPALGTRECQVAMLLVPKGTVRRGAQSDMLPSANGTFLVTAAQR